MKSLIFKRLIRMFRLVEALRPRLYMSIYQRLATFGGVQLTGAPRYVSSTVKYDDPSLVSLGERTVISAEVLLLTHDYSPTTALRHLGVDLPSDLAKRAPITIGDNAFIGIRTVIMPGSKIGSNVIVGAGAVVRGTIPDGVIVVGNPAEIVEKIEDRRDYWIALVGSSVAGLD